MNILVLGRGKTGSLVAEVARERGHTVRSVGSAENQDVAALTPDALKDTHIVIDFTTPAAVLPNISACLAAGKNVVVGTTGWYAEMPQVRVAVEQAGVGFIFGANFSVGVNLFFDALRALAPALDHGYDGRLIERHHAQKKDKPSGTAIAAAGILRDFSKGLEVEITSVREGEIVGEHTLELVSPHDTITLAHAAKSRRGFAEGAVRAAEWLSDKSGFYDFKEIYRQL